MEQVKSRRKTAPRNVVAGSVWESRMKMDEVKGGIKVFNGDEDEQTNTSSDVGGQAFNTNKSLEASGVREKRRTWKPEPIEVLGSSPRKIRLEPNKFGSKSCKDFDGIEKKPIQLKHTRSASHKDLNEKTIFIGDPKVDSNDQEEVEEKKNEDEEKKSFDVKEVDVIESSKPKRIVKEEKKVNPIFRKSIPISPNVKKQPSLLRDHHPINDQDVKKPSPIISEEESERFPQSHHNLDTIGDLLMWNNVAKSAFVFGVGSFILISFSYTDELNLSLISAMSYMGLFYLAAIFIYRSIICRGETIVENSIHLVGEEDAIWLLKWILPYYNEILLKLKAIFSGDPATTMKLAILLFVLARSGRFITIGKMVKLGFFGAFTIPKFCSSYSPLFTAHGKLVIQYLRDTWHSCSQKKAIAIVAFILLWNFSLTITRIWAVFMLMVTVRYYQQSSLVEEQGPVEVEGNTNNTNTTQEGRRQRGTWANNRLHSVKEKKES